MGSRSLTARKSMPGRLMPNIVFLDRPVRHIGVLGAHAAQYSQGATSDIEMHAFGSNCRRRPTNVRSSIALRDLTDGQQGRRHTSGVGRPSNRTSLVEWLLVVPAQDRFEPDERAC